MNITASNDISQLANRLSELSITDSLKLLSELFPGEVTFSSSFSFEDQVIAHEILSNNIDISIFTLDTGRLFAETYTVWTNTNEKYNARINVYYPDQTLLQPFITSKGPNSFYESVENRKACCNIRKVEPLRRALAGNKVWITGLRSEHSASRENLAQLEWDDVNQIYKFHPILHWNTEETRKYIDQNDIPYNPLHDRGFISIGCAPCTRAIRPGEDFRAGRWWWEDASKKSAAYT